MKRTIRPATLPMLLGTKDGINAVARFLNVTGIGTRKWISTLRDQEDVEGTEGEVWHLERREDEGEAQWWGRGRLDR